MNTTSRILGEATWPPTEMELTDPSQAYYYAKYAIKGRFPEGEEAIARHPQCALQYARDVIEDPFPQGESAIATNPHWAYQYARYVIKGRFQEGEAVIAKDPQYAEYYLQAFPEAKIDWYAREWIDWTYL